MEIIQEKFNDLFADQLNALDVAFAVLCAGIDNAYAGKVEFDLDHSSSAFTSAHIHVSAECALTWGNGWSDWSASGRIDWTTTSGHEVHFVFDRAENSPVNLVRVEIGNDESESFYPWIRSVCERENIPIEVIQHV